MEQESDEQLIERIVQGEQEAFQILVNRHKNYIFTLLYRELNHRETAEDLAQDVFVKIFRSVSQFRGEAKFTTWLYRMTMNILLDYRRAQKRRPLTTIMDSIRTWFTDQRDEKPEERVLALEQQQQVHQILHRMSEKYRIVLELYHLQQFSYQEMAAILDVPVRTIETRLYRAKQQFERLWMEVYAHEAPFRRATVCCEAKGVEKASGAR